MPGPILMKLGRTNVEVTSILLLGCHGDISLATVAKGLVFAENHNILVYLPKGVGGTHTMSAYM